MKLSIELFLLLILAFYVSSEISWASSTHNCDINLSNLNHQYNSGTMRTGNQEWQWMFPKTGFMACQQALFKDVIDQIQKYPYDTVSTKLAQDLLASLIPLWGARGHLFDLDRKEWVAVALGPDLERKDYFLQIARSYEGNWISSHESFSRVWKSYFMFSRTYNKKTAIFDVHDYKSETLLVDAEFHPERLVLVFKSARKKIKVFLQFRNKIPSELTISKLPIYPFSELFIGNELSGFSSHRFDLTAVKLNEVGNQESPRFDYPRENILFSGNSEYPW